MIANKTHNFIITIRPTKRSMITIFYCHYLMPSDTLHSSNITIIFMVYIIDYKLYFILTIILLTMPNDIFSVVDHDMCYQL